MMSRSKSKVEKMMSGYIVGEETIATSLDYRNYNLTFQNPVI